MDASALHGIGGIYNGQLFSQQLPIKYRAKHINVKEMFAILYAFLLWHEQWANGRVRLACDNSAVVSAIGKRSIRGDANRPLQAILLIAAIFDIELTAFWLPSKENIVADAASWFDFKKLANLGFQDQIHILRSPPPSQKITNLRQKLCNSLASTSLYGLKQAPRIWFLLLCQHIQNLGFKSCESDPSIYINVEKSIILSVYIDDILIFGLNQGSCESIFQQLSSQFKMQNLGPPTTFLGLNITWKANTISINQMGYIHRMLKWFNMQNTVPAKTPLLHSLPLLKATPLDRHCNQLEYTEITGSLNHLAVYSRPDIAFAVSILSQFNSDPTTTHL